MALSGLAVLYLICSTGFALATPYGEAPDEYSHMAYIEYLARFHKLPDITPNPYTNESFQPPLYYLLGAALVVGVRAALGSNQGALLAPPAIPNPAFNNSPSRQRFPALIHPP